MPEQISMQIISRLRQINQELSKYSKHLQSNFKVTVPQLICLREVYEYGPISIGALTKIVFLNNSTVTRIVDQLEKKEFVRRNRISKDRRQVHVEITDEGINFIKKAPAPLQRRVENRLNDMDETEASMILWSLEILVDMLARKKPTVTISAPPTRLTPPEGEILTSDI
ncbi:MAG: MarR family transcriptional regulator [Pseudomonadota bacterium]